MDINIQHTLNGNKGSFFIADAGKQLAEMTFSLNDEAGLIIHHTEVDDALRGKNIGYLLVKEAADFARHHHVKIIPQCPFAQAVFKRKQEELGDVLKSQLH